MKHFITTIIRGTLKNRAMMSSIPECIPLPLTHYVWSSIMHLYSSYNI